MSDNVFEMVQDRDSYNGRLIGNRFMIYQMAQISVTLSELESHFCYLKPFSTHNSGNIVHFSMICLYLHINQKVHDAYDFNFVVKSDKQSDILPSGISEMVQAGVTAGH